MGIIKLLFIALNLKAQVYTDKHIPWSPNHKVFDLMCFNENKEIDFVEKEIEVIAIKPTRLTYNKQGTLKVIVDPNCILEQKSDLTVSRLEFLEALHQVECDIQLASIKKTDFRILTSNKNWLAIKRLTDGKVWIFPTKICRFKQVLKAIKSPTPPPSPLLKVPSPIDTTGGLQ